MKRITSLVFFCGGLVILLVSSIQAQPDILSLEPVYVYLNFEGDPNFPSLTSDRNTTGLARFTGSAFRLPPQDRDWVVERIIEYVKFSFSVISGGKLNVEFVTDPTGLDSYYTWGIDDTSYIYQDAIAGYPGTYPIRLFGKAGGSPTLIGPGLGTEISDVVDANGNSIYFPKHARTWAGSFTLTTTAYPACTICDRSTPPLIPRYYCTAAEISTWNCGQFGDGTNITVSHIAAALSNSASHEIAHMLGAVHWAGDGLMTQGIEREEGRRQSFGTNNARTMRDIVGPAPYLKSYEIINNTTSFDGTVTDTGTGSMWTRDANLPSNIWSYGTYLGGGGTGAMFNYEADYYTFGLWYSGYHDWRTPSVNEMSDLSELVLSDGTSCTDFPYEIMPFVNVPYNLHHWTSDSAAAGNRLGFDVCDGSTINFASNALSLVWPVRDAYQLVDNGDGTVTDTSRGLMWAQAADPAGGEMTWLQAKNWAENLALAGFDDWRLPRLGDPDASCDEPGIFSGLDVNSRNCSRSELGHLYYRYGIKEDNQGPFDLVDSYLACGALNCWTVYPYYWFETDWFGAQTNKAWRFNMTHGEQGSGNKTAPIGVPWAVREIQPGDTSSGSHVRVKPDPNISVTFDEVTQAGVTTVARTSVNPVQPTDGFETLGDFMNISTTAIHDGTDEVCLYYSDSDIPAGMQEGDLRIFVWVEYYDFWTNSYISEWRDVAIRTFPNEDDNVLCGFWSPDSWFVLGVHLDGDNDGWRDLYDNCPDVSNPDQNDVDGDEIGDACDPVNDLDTDGDGVIDGLDNCPLTFNGDQSDGDGDGIGDACEGAIDDDGDVDRDDIAIIMNQYRNQDASVCPECDLNGDGVINALDARLAVLNCTRPRCATE